MGAGRLNGTCPPTLEKLIGAICADYGRRCRDIEEGRVSLRVEMEYKYINYRIFEGAAEIVGREWARVYIDEIGSNTGYAKSVHPASCEAGYKREKREVKLSIARKLHLM